LIDKLRYAVHKLNIVAYVCIIFNIVVYDNLPSVL